MPAETCLACHRRSNGAWLCPLCRKRFYLYYLPPALAGLGLLMLLLVLYG